MKNLTAFFGYAVILLICASCRVTLIGRETEYSFLKNGVSPVYTFWHGRLFYFPFLYRNQKRHSILVSPSKDGEVIGNVLRLFGFRIIWGSTFKKGARALLGLVRKVKENESVVLIADGSRGPLHKVQPGALGVARMTGAPIIPMTFSSNRKVVFSSWDKFLLPLPFSKIVVLYGKPFSTPRYAKKEVLESVREDLEKELQRITREADSFFEKKPASRKRVYQEE